MEARQSHKLNIVRFKSWLRDHPHLKSEHPMDVQLDRLEKNQEKILDKLSEHSLVLARFGYLHDQNTRDLTHHILRTDLLEEALERLKEGNEQKAEGLSERIEEAFFPKEFFANWAKSAKQFAAIAAAAALVREIIKHYFSK